ncbi:MAG: helix-turn-helix transcriptional regulator [Actinomycetota bacterium]|nr:helix-turn-helix transcriptional regulator [Actinomycetota bacterium]
MITVMTSTPRIRTPGSRILHRARSAAGITQRELAARSGVPHATIARIEAGFIASPKLDTLLVILAGIGFGLELAGLEADEGAV